MNVRVEWLILWIAVWLAVGEVLYRVADWDRILSNPVAIAVASSVLPRSSAGDDADRRLPVVGPTER